MNHTKDIEKQVVPVHFETFVDAVDLIIPDFLANYSLRIGTNNSYRPGVLTKTEHAAIMQSDKLTESEINVELWDVALHSALRDTSFNSYPHYSTMKYMFNYLLNDHHHTDFGLASEVITRLLTLHPPSLKSMSTYYQHILQDHYALINDKGEEDQSFFWVVVDMMGSLPKSSSQPFQYEPHPPPVPEQFVECNIKVIETLRALKGNVKSSSKNVVFYNNLSPSEKQKRCTFCLQFLCDILEDDLLAWLRESESSQRAKPTRRTFLACLLWPDVRQEGHVTPYLQRILSLQDRGLKNQSESSKVCERLLAMTAEVVRSCDRQNKRIYPFLDTFSSDLARELGLLLLQRFKDGHNVDILSYLKRLKPAWLRLLTVCRVLGDLAGFQCHPEIISVITIMEHLELIFKIGRQEKRMKENFERSQADPTLVAKFGKLKSVNSFFRTGLSRLHTACRENNVESVQALLTFPSLDLNLTDPSGWTALHEAAGRGNEACVRELLVYSPRLGDVQRRVDTRARGPGNITPLMRAVEAKHATICRLLLKHTGSVLLEDITDENETALNLCDDEAVRKVLQEFENEKVETIYSRKEIHLATADLSLVAGLCSCLIQSYMSVHRTWDVYHAVKRFSKAGHKRAVTVPRVLCEYSRYHRDFKTNLPKLREMVMKLRKVPQLYSISDVFHCIVSQNRD